MNRIWYHMGSTLLLIGAFALGGVLHAVFIRNSISIIAPASIFGIGVGLVLLMVGRRLERRSQETLLPADDSENEGDEADDEFDEEAAPFNEDNLSKYDRDDSY